jgi:ABC-type dipeptide/oligopeptide/nickel transport system permease subunit
MLAANFGTLLSPGSYPYTSTTLWTAVFPSLAILATVAAAAVLGEQLRKALDPHAS